MRAGNSTNTTVLGAGNSTNTTVLGAGDSTNTTVLGAGNSTNTTTYHSCQCGVVTRSGQCFFWGDNAICVDPEYDEHAAADRTGVPSTVAAILLFGALASELF